MYRKKDVWKKKKEAEKYIGSDVTQMPPNFFAKFFSDASGEKRKGVWS